MPFTHSTAGHNPLPLIAQQQPQAFITMSMKRRKVIQVPASCQRLSFVPIKISINRPIEFVKEAKH